MIKELSEEQVRTMTLEEKDQWWLKNVYKGDMPQLTIRSALTGMILGGILSLTNLYIGIKTGWTLGVGISSVILSFAFFKLIQKLKLGSEMSILENNAMQSIATSAGYMTAPMMASIPAYMMVTGQVIPMWQCFWWIVVLSLLGVLFAFPLKRRFINDEQMPFPEGYAAGVVLDSLHDEDGKQGMFKAKLMMIGAGLSALIEILRADTLLAKFKMGFLAIPHYWDDFIYKFATPAIMGTPLKHLTVQFDTSIVMMGTGGLMSMKTAMSILLGAFINYFLLAPVMIDAGIITDTTFKAITMWSLWGGAAVMTTSSLYSFFSKPQIIIQSFKKMFSKKEAKDDILEKIELPMWIFAVGIPVIGALTVYLGHIWFGIHYWLGIIAIPLVFVFTLIAVTSTGLTAITPGGALGKLTQITYGALAPGNVTTNLMTAGITSEVSLNASNLLMDIKPSYMLGGKPRLQALGHILGIFAGGLIAVPVFYSIFHGDISLFTTDALPLPSALVWKGVSEVLTKGLSNLHYTAQIAAGIGAVLGIVIEIANKKMNGKFPLSGVGLGLGFVLRFADAWSMALGTLIFWVAKKMCKNKDGVGYRAFVDNQETLAAGVIAGGSIIGIILILLEQAV
ncbi:OPT family oligopeptide transporter [Peredibacter starrii]|uniref:OPT family oligopeptide transporter n=1 Tax=Peredibacter starrii TaxID=28202 RepID=A0AAX4HSB7_9BACT|nr:OPT family oligopeptide transporter [Peredibacter starrii]WPU65988.1 OPT family oligopeptide transporter [Peredibacter starrii]